MKQSPAALDQAPAPGRRPLLEPVQRPDVIPLSFAQQGLWFQYRLDGPGATSNTPSALRLHGSVDVPALRRALADLTARHECLRTLYHDVAGSAQQRVLDSADAHPELMVRHLTPEELPDAVQDAARHPFDLSAELPMRVDLCTLDEREHVLVLVVHHIACDVRSLAPLSRDLAVAYAARCRGEAPSWAPLPVQYIDYTLWQRELLGSAADPASVLSEQLAYWSRTLADLPAHLALPTDRPRPARSSHRRDVVAFDLEPDLHDRLTQLAHAHGAGLYMVLHAGLAALLTRLGCGTDLPIGHGISGRRDDVPDDAVGVFANTLVMRTDTSGDPTFTELLARVRETALAASARPNVPFEHLVELLDAVRYPIGHPVVQVAVVLQDTPDVSLSLPGLQVRPEPATPGTPRLDLLFNLSERPGDGRAVEGPSASPGGLRGTVEFSMDLFDRDTVDTLVSRFVRLLEAVTTHDQAPISRIDLLSVAERGRLLPTARPPVAAATFPTLFEEWVQRTPDAEALRGDTLRMTYAELDARANQLARILAARRIGAGQVVALAFPRSGDLIVAMLAVLKAGAAYLPLDLGYPAQRLAYMLGDARPALVLTGKGAVAPPGANGLPVLDLTGELTGDAGTVLAGVSPEALTADERGGTAHPAEAAYVIYTSGSTGRPKGVVVTHAGIAALDATHAERLDVTPGSRVLQFASPSFDASFQEVCMALLRGATLVVAPPAHLLPGRDLAALVARHGITHLTIPPTALGVMAPDQLPSVRTLSVAGEACPADLAASWSRGRPMTNIYGPTESTMCATIGAPLTGQDTVVSIGDPIRDTRIHILGPALEVLPPGVTGELYIAGPGLARGYHGRAALTAERFVADPYGPAGERMYRTGDLVRHTATGALEFVGRIDDQVKVRGFRIELGEVESALRALPEVAQAAATVITEGGSGRLIGYIVAAQDALQDRGTDEDGDRAGLVDGWRRLYDDLYSAAEPAAFGADFRGWDSSYDGSPIPEVDMREWQDATVSRIRELDPRRVVEIGVGRGLILSRVAPHCEQYWGTDLSSAVIDGVAAQLVERLDLVDRVTLRSQPADDFTGLPAEYFDTVVLNSVVQYFPDVDYLTRVIAGAMRLLVPGGTLFIGDVRNLRLLRTVRTATAALAPERELLVDPDYFPALARHLPGIDAVDVRMKRATKHNELSRYRYDVILRRRSDGHGTTALDRIPVLDWSQVSRGLLGIATTLADCRGDTLRLINIPNARLAGEATAAIGDEVDPESLNELGERLGYQVVTTWSAATGHEHDFDAVFLAPTVDGAPSALDATYLPVLSGAEHPVPLSAFTNMPADPATPSDRGAAARARLREVLPDHLVPSVVVVIDALPLTPNGKIDRAALPRPRARSGPPGRTPATRAERILCEIVADVLALPVVGVDDDFFELGGDSISAVLAVGRARSTGVGITSQDVFRHRTIARLAAAAGLPAESESAGGPPSGRTASGVSLVRPSRAGLERIRAAWRKSMPHTDIEDVLPLAPLQEGLLFHTLYDELAVDLYTVQNTYELDGPLDTDVLRAASAALLRRNASLRSGFWHDGLQVPVAVVARAVELPWDRHDLSALEPAARAVEADRLAQRARLRRFDPSRPPLVRFAVIRLGPSVHRLVITAHHLVTDGWSLQLLLDELLELYARRGDDNGMDVVARYRDYLEWLVGQDREAARDEWRHHLAGLDGPSRVAPEDPFRTAGIPGKRVVQLPTELAAGLDRLAARTGVTRNTLFMAAWAVVLGQLTGRDDVVFGTTVAGRPPEIPSSVRMLGLLANTVPARVRLDPRKSLAEIIVELQADQTRMLPFAHVGLAEIGRILGTGEPFDTAYVYENLPRGRVDPATAVEGLRVRTGDRHGVTHYPLNLRVTPGPNLKVQLEHQTELFGPGAAQAIADRVVGVLEKMVTDPGQALGALDIGTPAERRRVLTEWNRPVVDSDPPLAMHLFAEQVARTPHATAVTDATTSLAYAELDEQVAGLAARLARAGVGPDTPVGVCLGRSAAAIAAILAVWRAGGVVVALDPGYPGDRLAYMLADSGASIVVSSAEAIGALGDLGHRTAVLLGSRAVRRFEAGARVGRPGTVAAPRPDHGAYIVYTSGSTGRPKGVLVTHRGLANLSASHRANVFEPAAVAAGGRRLRVAHTASLAFDASFGQLIGLLAGHELHIVTDDVRRDPAALTAHVHRAQLDYLGVAPSMLRELLATGLLDGSAAAPRVILLGAEATGPALWRTLRDHPQVQVHNYYAPSECTVDAVGARVNDSLRPTIGRAVQNMRAYLLDDRLRLVPPGIVGEIFLAGAQVARGYVNQPGPTAGRFVADPYGAAGSRMYRTGDLGRWTERGTLEFVGRADDQMEVRGHRIEPGEIEAVLIDHAAVRSAVVVVREDRPGDQRLTAYVVAEDGVTVDVDALRDHMSRTLPGYMIPSAIVVVGAFPLTPSGKVARRELPPPRVAVDPGRAPRGQLEETLCEIFAEVLALPAVGPDAGFFASGGHSLLATRLVSRIRDVTGATLSVRDVFEAPSVAGLARRVATAAGRRPELVAASVPERPAVLPLSFAQQRFWFMDQMEGPNSTYDMPFAVTLDGLLDVAALRAALTDVVARHEVLRTVYPAVDGVPRQEILPAEQAQVELPVRVVTAAELSAVVGGSVARRFDLATEIPLHAELLELGPESHVLVLVIHHIAGDGWSNEPLARDLAIAYRARVRGSAPRWQPLPVQYADFALWQRGELGAADGSDGMLSDQLAFWQGVLADLPTELALRTQRPRADTIGNAAATVPVTISAAAHARLGELAKTCDASIFMVVQAVLAALLTREGAGTDIVIGTPVAGRPEIALDDLVGCFVNTLVLRTDTGGAPSLGELVRRVRTVNLSAYRNQDLPFEQLVDVLRPQRSVGRHPLFQVMMTFQHAARMPVDLPGVRCGLMELPSGPAKFDLMFRLGERRTADGAPDGIVGEVQFRTDLFGSADMTALVSRFERLATGWAAGPDRPCRDIDVLSAADRQRLLEEWSGATADPPPLSTPLPTLPEMFDRQVRRTPDATALVAGSSRLTYRELDSWATRHAHELVRDGAGPERVVAIALPRGLESVVALVAVTKSGAAHLPIDLELPPARVETILRDADPVAVVDDVHAVRDARELPDVAPPIGPRPANAAYVLHTSGSTGTPKGVVVAHEAVTNRLRGLQEQYGLEHTDVILHKAPLTFDASVFEVFWPLTVGASVAIAGPQAHRDPAEIAAVIEEHRVTTVHFVPSMLRVFLDEPGVSRLGSLRRVQTGGESLSTELLELTRARLDVTMNHLYGPTETAMHATAWTCSATPPQRSDDDVAARLEPIGRPVPDLRVYVLDDDLGLTPPGVVGELYVAGVQLARGYLGQSALTAERFVACPFEAPGDRMYRTGDLVRWRSDGVLEFCGRTDGQVKIHGRRVELGEIESVLAEHPAVAAAAVHLQERVPDEKIVVGYVVAHHDAAPPRLPDLVEHTKRLLPAHMVPATVVVLDAMPTTAAGKLDRLKLPNAHLAPTAAGRSARTVEEGVLCTLFADLLGVAGVGIDDDFFALGGNSLMAVRLISRVRDTLGLDLSVRDLFVAPTVGCLAERLRVNVGGDAFEVLLPLRTGSRPPLFCVHPASGLSWCYTGLLRHLPPDQPVYGLQSRGLSDPAAMPATMDELVADYVEQIRSVQGKGPYHLLGWSFGGVVAQAIAARLQAAGDEVPLLALLDAYPRDQAAEATPVVQQELLGVVLGFAGHGDRVVDGQALQIDDVVRIVREGGGALQAIDETQVRRLVDVYARNGALSSSHVPPLFDGGLLHVTAGAEDRSGLPTAQAWRQVISGPMDTITVDCTHQDMCEVEPLAVIAAALTARLVTDLVPVTEGEDRS